VVAASGTYLWLLAAGLPFGMVTLCFKNFSEAQNVPWPAFWSGLIAVLLNVFLNWLWIYGNWGAPELGLEGAGLATLVSRIFGLVLLIVWLGLDGRFAGCWPQRWLKPPQFATVAKVFRLGLPVSTQLFIEVGALSIASLVMGMIGVMQLAAHQIAISCAATTFMVPLGISFAVVIRVGHAIGSGEPQRVGRITFGAIAFVALLSGLFATTFLVFADEIASVFTTDPATRLLAAQLIVIAGIFQLVDAIQVTTLGALRGLKDVTVPTLMLFVVYWLICLPVGAWLALSGLMGAPGVWVGLAAGLGLAAAALLVRFHFVLKALQGAKI
jgi:MATE family multidrug resistance protein